MLQGLMFELCRVMKHLAIRQRSRALFDRQAARPQLATKNKPAARFLLLSLVFLSAPILAATGDDTLKLVKIANDGSELPDTAALGTKAKDWACTLDTATGLIWEVKTTSGLRASNNSYSWYSSEGRAVGSPSGGSCFAEGRCDTEKYIADVNSSSLCGAHDWRMPQAKELEAHFAIRSTSPAVYASFFPNTTSTYYWSGTPGAFYSFSAWAVYISDAQAYYFHRTGTNGIRAVRKSQ
jgi:hypothetical protein